MMCLFVSEHLREVPERISVHYRTGNWIIIAEFVWLSWT